MRTMFYEFPEDATCWDITDLHVRSDIRPSMAPIVRAKQRAVPFICRPVNSGRWQIPVMFMRAEKAYEIEAPIETLPIFLRDGKQGYLVGEI